jgi:PadR family transcriptional regulator, regulatory protein PadR
MKKPQTESDSAPLGSFEEQVMLAVARLKSEAYAVTVRREIEEQTERQIAMGAVYATLDRLEAKKLVASRREAVEGLPRRMFALTTSGVVALMQTKEMRERLWDGVDLRKLRLT